MDHGLVGIVGAVYIPPAPMGVVFEQEKESIDDARRQRDGGTRPLRGAGGQVPKRYANQTLQGLDQQQRLRRHLDVIAASYRIRGSPTLGSLSNPVND